MGPPALELKEKTPTEAQRRASSISVRGPNRRMAERLGHGEAQYERPLRKNFLRETKHSLQEDRERA